MSKIIIQNDTTPTIPDVGKTALYIDSVTKKLVSMDDTGSETAYDAASAGSGDVIGPVSSVDSNVAMFDGITGKLLKDSGLTLSGSNTGDQTSVTGNSGNTDALKSATTTIDVVSAVAPSTGQVLTATSSTTATWQDASGGGSTEDVIFNSSLASTIPLTLTGSASQTADLLRIEDSTNTRLTSIESDGGLVLPTSSSGTCMIRPEGDSVRGIQFRNVAGSTAELYLFAGNTAGTHGLKIGKNGTISFGAQYGYRSNPRGSASIPAYQFNTDNDTGMYSPSANNLGLTAGAVQGLNLSTTIIASKLPHEMASYATGSLPTASSYEGCLVYDSTTKTIKWSNGTVWATL